MAKINKRLTRVLREIIMHNVYKLLFENDVAAAYAVFKDTVHKVCLEWKEKEFSKNHEEFVEYIRFVKLVRIPEPEDGTKINLAVTDMTNSSTKYFKHRVEVSGLSMPLPQDQFHIGAVELGKPYDDTILSAWNVFAGVHNSCASMYDIIQDTVNASATTKNLVEMLPEMERFLGFDAEVNYAVVPVEVYNKAKAVFEYIEQKGKNSEA